MIFKRLFTEEADSFTLEYVSVAMHQGTNLTIEENIENGRLDIIIKIPDNKKKSKITIMPNGDIMASRFDGRIWWTLQEDYDKSLKFFDTKPYGPTKRKYASLPSGLEMIGEG